MNKADTGICESRIHYRILKHLIGYNEIHPFVSLERAELVKELNMDDEELDRGIRYLEERMLLETVWFMGGDYWTKVSQEGIDEMYMLEKDPEKGTRNFPSYYKIHYG